MMNNQKTITHNYCEHLTRKTIFPMSCIFLGCLISFSLFAQSSINNKSNDTKLINDYIHSRTYSGYLTFDASNIKQYWTDNSVISKNNTINISLNKTLKDNVSIPYKIQLINVDESQICNIDIISDNPDLLFTIEDNNTTISSDSKTTGFISQYITSLSFPLKDTKDFSFFIKFSSKSNIEVVIREIILSFSDSKKKTVVFSQNDIANSDSIILGEDKFTVTGKQSYIVVDKTFDVNDNTLTLSAMIKNSGDIPARIAMGYATFAKDGKRIDFRHYPYKNGKTVKVISSKDNSIIVDSLPEWKKGCYVCLNAKDDFSDIPNFISVGNVLDVKKNDDGSNEIILNKPLVSPIEKGSLIRLTEPQGGSIYLYTNSIVLQPGEERVLSSRTPKDDNWISYSGKNIPKGVDSVKPIILSFSTDSSKENTIAIKHFSISF